jgi:hypothetical protein
MMDVARLVFLREGQRYITAWREVEGLSSCGNCIGRKSDWAQ